MGSLVVCSWLSFLASASFHWGRAARGWSTSLITGSSLWGASAPLTAHIFGVPAGPGRPAFPLPHLSLGFQGDQGGLRTLQKKWTSFLKARLICSRPDSNLVFNVLRDVFVLRSPDLKEPVFYGVFTPQL